jgi:ABC-type antimicrobial peptide transport system permease subunit
MRVVVVFEILMTLLIGTAAMGVGLALVGLYGLVAYGVSRRTKEIAIRCAIGASTTEVLRLAIRQGVLVTLAGLVVGLPAGIAAARVLATTLPAGLGRTTTDTWAFAGLVATTLAIALLAAYVPARRALAVAPIHALRAE